MRLVVAYFLLIPIIYAAIFARIHNPTNDGSKKCKNRSRKIQVCILLVFHAIFKKRTTEIN